MPETNCCFTPVSSPLAIGSATKATPLPPVSSSTPSALMDAINGLIMAYNRENGNVSYGSNSGGGAGGIGGLGGSISGAQSGFGGGSLVLTNRGKPKQDDQRQGQKNPLDPGNQSGGTGNKRDAQRGNDNSQRPQGQRNTDGGQGPWREDKGERQTSKQKITNPDDPSQFVEIERLDGFSMQNRDTGEVWKWSR